MSKFVRKTYYLGTADEQAIASIQERHGFSTASDAVRYALRKLEQIEQETQRKQKPLK